MDPIEIEDYKRAVNEQPTSVMRTTERQIIQTWKDHLPVDYPYIEWEEGK